VATWDTCERNCRTNKACLVGVARAILDCCNMDGGILCLLAVITSVIYPKQRRFPACMCAILCAVDGVQWTKEWFKYSNYGPLSESLVWQPSKSVCALLYMWNVWSEAATFICTTSLALIIYLAVVKKIDVSYGVDKRYFWGFWITFMLYTTIFTVVSALYIDTFGYTFNSFSCSPNTTIPGTVGAVQTGVAVIIEVALIGAAIRYAKEVFRSVRNTAEKRSSNTTKICIKFAVIIVLQTLPRLYNASYYLLLAAAKANGDSPTQIREKQKAAAGAVIVPAVCFWVNAVYVMASNKHLKASVRKRFSSVVESISSFSGKLSHSNTTQPLSTSASSESISVEMPTIH